MHTYHSVGQNSLTSADVYFATRPNTILLTDWNPTNNWADIASQNAAIDQMATSIAAVSPAKVMVALSHEPENNVSPGGDPNCPSLAYKGTDGTVADYRNMWAYVENRFAADGVTNVVWVMDYMNDPTWQCLVNDLYPGDNLVDWILFNAYGSGSSPNFDNVVSSFYNYLTANSDAAHDYLAHPWGIAEWGINGYTVAKEEAYYDQAKTALDGNMFPNLKAYVVFDENAEGSATGNSCRVGYDDNGTWDPTKASHYYAFADDPRFTNAYYTTPPSVPGGLAAVAAASGSEVDLSWNASTDNVGVAGYQVFRDGAPVANVTTGTSYADTGLSDATSYQYTVAAYDAAGNVSAQSPAVTAVTPDTTPPSVPGGLAAAATSSGSEVDLSWNASTDNVGVAGYQVFRDGAPVANVTTGTSYADTGLSDGTSYQYTVAAYDAAGNVSAQSPAVTAVTPDVTPPSVPGGLAAVAAASGHEVDLSWNASTDNVGVAGYDVFRDGTQVANVTAGTSYADTGLSDATSYQYTVAAYDAAGNVSAQSPAVRAVTPDTTPPSVPTGLAAVAAASGHEVDLSWNASTDNVGVTGYQVFRDGTPVAEVTTGTSYADTGLTDGTSYQYTVAAYDAAGNVSAQSPAVTAVTPDVTPPSVPTGLQLALAAKSINLSWNASTDNVGVTGYAIYRNGTKIATTTSLTYSNTSVVQGKTYTYSVAAYDAAGNQSAQSAGQVMTFPDTTPPSVPTGLKLALAAKSIKLTWTASTDNVGVTGYAIYRNGTKIATTTSLTYSDTSVVQGMTYIYSVAAYDAAGNQSAQSAGQVMTFPDTTPPSVPTGLTAAPAASGTQVNLSWNASTDNVAVAGYKVFRNGTQVAEVTSGTSYADTGLTDATSYKYTVAAYDAAGNTSAQSHAVTAVTPDTTPPTQPTNLTLTPGSKSITLKWTASTDNVGVKGYYIYRGTTKIATVTATTYTDKNLTTGTTYSYYIVAFDAALNLSQPSATKSAAAK